MLQTKIFQKRIDCKINRVKFKFRFILFLILVFALKISKISLIQNIFELHGLKFSSPVEIHFNFMWFMLCWGFGLRSQNRVCVSALNLE